MEIIKETEYAIALIFESEEQLLNFCDSVIDTYKNTLTSHTISVILTQCYEAEASDLAVKSYPIFKYIKTPASFTTLIHTDDIPMLGGNNTAYCAIHDSKTILQMKEEMGDEFSYSADINCYIKGTPEYSEIDDRYKFTMTIAFI